MKVFPFTPESMQIIQLPWSIGAISLELHNWKAQRKKPVCPTSLSGIAARFISEFSETKLQSRKSNPKGMYYVSLLCIYEDNWSSSVWRHCVFLLPSLLLIYRERVKSVLSEMQSLEKLLQFTKDIQIPDASFSDI